jgi:ABC-2 type transport system ATP-binding protein
MSGQTALEARDLTKRYADVVAVEHLNLRIGRGEIYGFLGLNGAGKTTTIRMLLGMVRPSQGEARVLDTRVEPGTRVPWARVGHLVETAAAYPELTVRENLEVARRLYGVREALRTSVTIELLGLSAYADRRAGTLSLGNRQRLGLAKALLHEPEVLVLDEPANGLDPAGVVEVRELLVSLSRERGTTVFVSSHILSEVDRLASRIGIIHQGRLVEEFGAADLERVRRRRVVVGVRDPDAACAALAAAGFKALGGGQTLEIDDPRALERPDDIAKLLVEAGCPPMRLVVEQEDLETHFLRLTSGTPDRYPQKAGGEP